jgi:hypothetical protein
MAASFSGIQSFDYHISSVLSQVKGVDRAVCVDETRFDRFDPSIPPDLPGRAGLSVESVGRHAR